MLFRRRNDMNQVQAAKHFDVKPDVYRQWERTGEGAPSVALGDLKPHEICWLTRIRANVSQDSLAKAIGYCRWWVTQMEKGQVDCKPLQDYWLNAA